MLDLQVVYPQEMIELTSVSRIPNSDPQTLVVEGKDFRYVEEVLVNQMPAASFVVTSPKRMLVEIPSTQDRAIISTVSVLSRQFNMTARSQLRFKLRPRSTGARGYLYLVQLFVKMLLTTPGTDIFTPRVGGGVRAMVGRTFTAAESNEILNNFVMAVDQTKRNIVSIQSRARRLGADERLMGATVVGSNFDVEQGALSVGIEITPQSGRAGVVNLVA